MAAKGKAEKKEPIEVMKPGKSGQQSRYRHKPGGPEELLTKDTIINRQEQTGINDWRLSTQQPLLCDGRCNYRLSTGGVMHHKIHPRYGRPRGYTVHTCGVRKSTNANPRCPPSNFFGSRTRFNWPKHEKSSRTSFAVACVVSVRTDARLMLEPRRNKFPGT